MRENLSTRKCHIGLDARKVSSAKISTLTVCLIRQLDSIQYYKRITQMQVVSSGFHGEVWCLRDVGVAECPSAVGSLKGLRKVQSLGKVVMQLVPFYISLTQNVNNMNVISLMLCTLKLCSKAGIFHNV